jgi:hypothetical protein
MSTGHFDAFSMMSWIVKMGEMRIRVLPSIRRLSSSSPRFVAEVEEICKFGKMFTPAAGGLHARFGGGGGFVLVMVGKDLLEALTRFWNDSVGSPEFAPSFYMIAHAFAWIDDF